MFRNSTQTEPNPAAEDVAVRESTPAPGATEQGATPSDTTPALESQSDQRDGKNDWFRNAFNARRFGVPVARQPEAPAGPDGNPESGSPSGTPSSVQTSAETGKVPAEATASGTPEEVVRADAARDTLVLTPDELQRRVQAETDRRLDKYQREEAERRKREEKRRLRDTDPYAFAALEKEEEEKTAALQAQLAEVHKLASSTIETYDKSVLDPLMKLVPEQDRNTILSNIEPGLVGRGQAATQALKVLENHWKQEGVKSARDALMKDQSFIKEILARYGGMRQEPDNIPAAAASRGPSRNPNDAIRAAGFRALGRFS